MEDFKRIVKMKTGGSVSKAIAAYEKRERKVEEKEDEAQDKKIVKKAFKMHDEQSHEGKTTDLTKLKKGGRAKKEKGTVKKFCGGKKVSKYAEGGAVEESSLLDKGVDAVKSVGKSLYENVVGTPEQNKAAQESMNRQAAAGSKLAKFFGGKADAESAPVKKCAGGRMRKGGKVC